VAQATSLEHLAASDPSVAPLARLQGIALAAAGESGWSAGVPSLTLLSDRAPVLDGQTLTVDVGHQCELLVALAKALDPTAGDGAGLARRIGRRDIDPLALLAAGITADFDALTAAAHEVNIDAAVLAVVAQVASLPLLLACGERAADTLRMVAWPRGYCPVCGAFPTLAELRGLARERILRCGRCAAGWPVEHGRCPFCETRDQQSAGYFAPESQRESRRAVTCEECRSYLKTVTTLGALTPTQLLLRDLETLELDLTALEHDYSRPDGLGWPLTVTLEAAPGRKNGWSLGTALGWRR
jgi:FdhE protein